MVSHPFNHTDVDIQTWAVSPRGAGWLFGDKVALEVTPLNHQLTQFNHVNNLSLIARAHQLVMEGYKYHFNQNLVTVWSAPNYCYRCGNVASVMVLNGEGETGLIPTFKIFSADKSLCTALVDCTSRRGE